MHTLLPDPSAPEARVLLRKDEEAITARVTFFKELLQHWGGSNHGLRVSHLMMFIDDGGAEQFVKRMMRGHETLEEYVNTRLPQCEAPELIYDMSPNELTECWLLACIRAEFDDLAALKKTERERRAARPWWKKTLYFINMLLGGRRK